MDKKLNNEEIEKGVFVINQHYEIVYMDETAKQTFPGCEQHAFCYQMLQESKTPCFDCPLKKTGHQKIENRLLYNQKLEIWMEYVAIQVEWPKEGLCTLISMHAAAPGKAGSVIHAQTDGLLYAIVELHIQRDSFTMLYENLRQQPRLSQNGSLCKLLQKLCTRYVYKEKRIAVYSHVSCSVRILLHGAYRWMKFQITASSNEELTDTCLCMIDTMSEEFQIPQPDRITSLITMSLPGCMGKRPLNDLLRNALCRMFIRSMVL